MQKINAESPLFVKPALSFHWIFTYCILWHTVFIIIIEDSVLENALHSVVPCDSHP